MLKDPRWQVCSRSVSPGCFLLRLLAFPRPWGGGRGRGHRKNLQIHLHLTPPSPPASHSPESPAQLVVVHLGLAFPPAPQPGHFIRVLDDKLPVFALLPGDHVPELLLLQQLQDEVPELDLAGARAGFGLVRPVREMIAWQTKKQSLGSERSGYLQANDPSSSSSSEGNRFQAKPSGADADFQPGQGWEETVCRGKHTHTPRKEGDKQAPVFRMLLQQRPCHLCPGPGKPGPQNQPAQKLPHLLLLPASPQWDSLPSCLCSCCVFRKGGRRRGKRRKTTVTSRRMITAHATHPRPRKRLPGSSHKAPPRVSLLYQDCNRTPPNLATDCKHGTERQRQNGSRADTPAGGKGFPRRLLPAARQTDPLSSQRAAPLGPFLK